MPKRSGSRGKKKPSLSDLSREQLTGEELAAIIPHLIEESDRACVLIAASLLDVQLAKAIRLSFNAPVDDNLESALFFDPNAPLSSFSNKIDIAFALGHISEIDREDLHIMRRIRNVFAHSFKLIGFDNELVISECQKLMDPHGDNSSKYNTKERFAYRCLDILLEIYNFMGTILDERQAKLERERYELLRKHTAIHHKIMERGKVSLD